MNSLVKIATYSVIPFLAMVPSVLIYQSEIKECIKELNFKRQFKNYPNLIALAFVVLNCLAGFASYLVFDQHPEPVSFLPTGNFLPTGFASNFKFEQHAHPQPGSFLPPGYASFSMPDMLNFRFQQAVPKPGSFLLFSVLIMAKAVFIPITLRRFSKSVSNPKYLRAIRLFFMTFITATSAATSAAFYDTCNLAGLILAVHAVLLSFVCVAMEAAVKQTEILKRGQSETIALPSMAPAPEYEQTKSKKAEKKKNAENAFYNKNQDPIAAALEFSNTNEEYLD